MATRRFYGTAGVPALLLCLAAFLLLLPSGVQCDTSSGDDQGWIALPDGSETGQEVGLDAGWTGGGQQDSTGAEDPDYQPPDDTGFEDSGPDDLTSDPDYQLPEDSGYGDDDSGYGYDDSGYGYDDSGYGDDDSGYGYDDSGYGYDDSGYGYDESGYGDDDSGYGDDDSGYGYDESEYGYDDSGYGYDESEYGYDDSGYGYDEMDYGYDDSGYGYDDSGYDYDDSDYGYDDSGYGYENSDFGYDDSNYGYDDSGYGDDDSDFGYDDSNYGYDDSGYGYDDSDFGYDDSNYGYDDSGYGEFDGPSYGSRRRGGRRFERVQVRSARSAGSNPEESSEFPEMEFEDASAEAGEIPSGYFGEDIEEPSQQRRRPSRGRGSGGRFGPAFTFATGGIDLPGFQLVISPATEWWKYDRHVCLTKDSNQQPVVEEDLSEPDMSVYTVRCSEVSTTEYTCNITQRNSSAVSVEILSYTCCPGYSRRYGDRGCPRKVLESPTRNQTLASLLRQHGYSQKLIDLFSTVVTNGTSQQWTVFVPAKAAMDELLRKVNFDQNDDELPDWFVRTMLNHFAQPAKYTRAMRNGQRLATMAKTGGVFVTKTGRGDGRVLANCQPILRANQPFDGGRSLAHFTSAVLTVQQSSLHEMMLRKLETVVSPAEAEKLLAPLKSMLTGSKQPLTVFMHMPSKDEIDNGCYARNLRSAIVSGAQCNASLACGGHLRTVDGKVLTVRATVSGNRVLLGGNRLLVGADLLASNGVLHMVNATESMIGFANEVTRRLKSSSDHHLKRLLANANGTDGSVVFLMPPDSKGAYSYANASAGWENSTDLAAFAWRHLLANATALRGSVRLAMKDGAERDFVQLAVRQRSRSFFSGVSRRQFVDCVPVERQAKDCNGVVYFLMKTVLPDFPASPSAINYLTDSEEFSTARRIVQFAVEQNVTGLAERLRARDAALVLLADGDMRRLTGDLLSRRREPTRQQMEQLTAWFAKYLVASKPVCAIRSINNFVSLPVFNADLRPCRSLACAFRRRYIGGQQMRRVRLQLGGHVTVREGFLLPGSLL